MNEGKFMGYPGRSFKMGCFGITGITGVVIRVTRISAVIILCLFEVIAMFCSVLSIYTVGLNKLPAFPPTGTR